MNIQSGLFHDVSVWHTTHRFITDAAASRDLMTRADAFQIAPLESTANRGTAIMQGAICQGRNVYILHKSRKSANLDRAPIVSHRLSCTAHW